MSKFAETQSAAEFIATYDSRETSPEVMEAIAFFAADESEAETLWADGCIGADDFTLSVWECATGNGRLDDETMFWGGRSLKRVVAGE
jgi:hypothetical protein